MPRLVRVEGRDGFDYSGYCERIKKWVLNTADLGKIGILGIRVEIIDAFESLVFFHKSLDDSIEQV